MRQPQVHGETRSPRSLGEQVARPARSVRAVVREDETSQNGEYRNMSKVLRTLRRAFVVLLVATLGFATASAAFADESTGDGGKSDEVHQTKENGPAQSDEDKGNASSHQTTAQDGAYTEPQ